MTGEKSLRVVCVDGDESALTRTVEALETARFTVRATTDPSEVVGLVARTETDCVVSEYAFENTDGIRLLGHVRAHAPDVAFVLYTDAGSEAIASEAIGAGVTDYVVKPADPSVLADRVASAVAAVEDRVVALDRLREHRRFVDDALDSLGDVFYVVDTEGRMIQWNQRFNELFGYDDAEIASKRAWEFVTEEDRPTVVEAIEVVLAEGSGDTEVSAVLADGSQIRLDLHGQRLTDTDGTVVGLCGIGRDVTERERTEWQLRTQNERLEAFASVLSHDLRNPLSIADGYLQLAREDGDLSYLERVADAHERMARIIDDVLTTTRQGQIVEETTRVSLDSAATSAWNSVATDGARLDIQTDRELQADPMRLQRLLENLFRNSVEHGSTGSRDGRSRPDDSVEHGSTSNRSVSRSDDSVEHGTTNARSRAREDADGVETLTVTVGETPDGFFVADDGPGIAAEIRDRAFEVGVTTGEGTGFGLSIVQSLVEAHGWAVTVTDADGGGARFEFTTTPRPDD
jgi:PAS domain S-box-containing protein